MSLYPPPGIYRIRWPALLRLSCLLLLLAAGGCATPYADSGGKTVSQAWVHPGDTALGRRFAPPAKAAGKSGVLLLARGDAAFGARVTLADAAEKTLDAQYYIWRGDATGKLMLTRLLAAARRGVRVRLLIDDVGLSGLDFSLAVFDAYPNFEVRVFNPFSARVGAPLSWLPEIVINSDQLNHRMHNKAFIADGAVAVIGGRNIGDEYFGVGEATNFRDLDLLVAGPAAADMERVFDTYWNSTWAVPVHKLVGDAPQSAKAARATDVLDKFYEDFKDYPYPYRRDAEQTAASLNSLENNLIWAPATVVADTPAKVEEDPAAHKVQRNLAATLQDAHSELLLESAYFIPRTTGVNFLSALEHKGVKVRVLTNSLASSDVALTFAGYAKYREPLLAAGVELHEFRPDGRLNAVRPGRGRNKSPGLGGSGSSRVNLHTKAIVIDRSLVFLGTPNLDPRSMQINTEMGLWVEDPRLASQVADFIESGFSPQNSWALSLDAGQDIVWTSERGGVKSEYHHDPEAGWLREIAAPLLKHLPVEGEL